jgi:predicted PurR-regulated permease PerM
VEPPVESKELRDDLSEQAGTPEQQSVPLQRVPLPIPTDVRNLSLLVLAVLASVFALHLAQSVFIPIVFGILIGYALDPIVTWFGRWKIPRPISAAVLLLALVAAFGSSVYLLRDDAAAIVDTHPVAAQNLR